MRGRRRGGRWNGVAAVASVALFGCGGSSGDAGAGGDGGTGATTTSGGGGGEPWVAPPPTADGTRDIVHTALSLDVATRAATASITLTPSESEGLSLRRGLELSVVGVRQDGRELQFETEGDELRIGVPASSTAPIDIAYGFPATNGFDGWNPSRGVSFLWPHFCGNLFPCRDTPDEGSTFELTVTGVPAGQTGVFPTEIPAEAPSYMPAVATGDFTDVVLGTTPAGTTGHAWHLPGEAAETMVGTQNLLAVFSFYEATLGSYLYGRDVGSVSAAWGNGAFGGMEHHPYWHVSQASFSSQITHAHEAAHGWFGNGVRIACWEDFVLSEGVATYLAARSLESLGVDVWSLYECELVTACTTRDTVALPDTTCNEIDLINHPLWSPAPYYKGAYFLRNVADLIGASTLDGVLAGFYDEHRGRAARMGDLIGAIVAAAPTSASATLASLVEEWLRTPGCPVDVGTLCPPSVAPPADDRRRHLPHPWLDPEWRR
ncbi:MAG: M1 family aminopeptidase [Myxococcota bacterium]